MIRAMNKKINKVSEIYNLNKTQFELDFVDIYLEVDTPLYLDSAYISAKTDEWSKNASSTIRNFFDNLLSLITNNQINEAKKIFTNFEEPTETHLGVSQDSTNGKGVGKEKSEKIFKNILQSHAATSGLLEDLEDCHIFVENFGPDNLSDMITNIIKLDLINYTQEQAKLWNMSLTSNVSSGQYWDVTSNQWSEKYTDMLVIGSKKIILVPKNFVVRHSSFNPYNYHSYFVLEFLKTRNLKSFTPILKTKNLKSGETKVSISKKSIKENTTSIHYENGYNICSSKGDKNDLSNFSKAFPTVYKTFKTEILKSILSESKNISLEFSPELVAQKLLDELPNIQPGNDHASKFHQWSIGAFEFLFDGQLQNPIKECEIDQGRKRIDIRFSNNAHNGIFWKIAAIDRIPSSYIYIECKNYSKDINNPELDQMGGRFSDRKGKFGIIHCRKLNDRGLFLERCRDSFNAGRGLIIFLTDEELQEALTNIINTTGRSINKIIEDIIDEVRS